MSCKNVCKLCNHLVISQAVAFTGGNLVITLPAGSYNNGEKYCIVIAQSIPETTTINAPVVIQIGTGTTLYPLQNRCCAQVTACGVRTRTKYATRVSVIAFQVVVACSKMLKEQNREQIYMNFLGGSTLRE